MGPLKEAILSWGVVLCKPVGSECLSQGLEVGRGSEHARLGLIGA